MNKKILLFGLVFVLLMSGSVLGAFTDDLIRSYSFDTVAANITDSSTQQEDFSTYNFHFKPEGKLNGGAYFDSIGTFATIPWINATSWSSCSWVNFTAAPGSGTLLWGSPGDLHEVDLGRDGNKIRNFVDPNSDDFSYTFSLNTWTHFCIISREGTNVETFINGASLGNLSATDVGWKNNTRTLGNTPSKNRDFDGMIDEFKFWNRSILFTEVGTDYNNSGGYNPFETVPITESYNSNSFEGVEESFSIVFDSFNATNSTNATLVYDGVEYPGIINYTNSNYFSFTSNVTLSVVYANATANSFNWTYQIDYENGTILNGSTSPNTQTLSWNLTTYPRVNVTGLDIINNVYVKNFTINDSNRTHATLTGDVYFYSDGSATLPLTFNDTQAKYQRLTKNVTFTAGTFGNYTFDLYTTNSFNFSFRDEITETVINQDIVVEFVSDVSSYNYTAHNGTLYVDLITPTNYTIRYSTTGYGRVRNYLYELTDRTHNNLTLYLIDDGNGTETTVTIYDSLTSNVIEGVVVYLQRYYVDTNTYRTVAMYETDVGGKSYFDVQQDDEYYKFQVDYPWTTTRVTTVGQYLSETSYNIYLDLQGVIAGNFFDEETISGSINYVNATETFSVDWTDASGVATQYCLYLKRYGQYALETINSSCSASPSGSISLGGVINDTVTYALFTANIDGEERVIASGWKEIISSKLNAGLFGLFMAAIVFMTFTFITRKPTFALIISTVSLMFSKLLGIFEVGWPYILIAFIASCILAIIIENKK